MDVSSHDQEIVKKDRNALYLGNLNTVAFDLKLPVTGKYGSAITWASKDPRWINEIGTVHRPEYGRGNRTVPIIATFTYGNASVQEVYEVTILQEKNKIQVDKIFPVVLEEKAGQLFYLPLAVAIRTQDGDIIAHAVTWDEGERRTYTEIGVKTVHGKLKDTDDDVQATIHVQCDVDAYLNKPVRVRSFPPGKVRLSGTGSLFKQAQDRRLAFLLKVNDDQMLYNFRVAAGLGTKNAPKMIGWDSPDSLLRGHTTGHYLSALSLCFGATGNRAIRSKLNYMIEELNRVQMAFEAEPDCHHGFLSAYSEKQFDLLERETPYPKIWAPYYTMHKIFAGLLDSYRIAGIDLALIIADKLGEWVYRRLNRLSHEQLQKMWSMYIAGEFGGMNESLAELYTCTRKKEHIKAAKFFDNNRLFFPMEQQIDALGSLHANQHIPQMIGAIKMFRVTSERKYYDIASFFWHSVVNAHIYSIGGTGEGEMFRQPYRIATYLSDNTAETCASYNMLKLTNALYAYDPDVTYADYYERVMFNHILATTDHENLGASTYFMPTRPGGQKQYDHDENTCCHGTGLENHFKYGDAIYFSDEEAFYVNQFVPSSVSDQDQGIVVEQSVQEPFCGRIDLLIHRLTKKQLNIRLPYWHAGAITASINQTPIRPEVQNGYLTFNRAWTADDQITVQFTPTLRIEPTPDKPDLVSVAFGPYILAALSDQESFLELPLTHDNLTDVLIRLKGTNHFMYDQRIEFVPLAEINHQHYHLYIRIAQSVLN